MPLEVSPPPRGDPLRFGPLSRALVLLLMTGCTSVSVYGLRPLEPPARDQFVRVETLRPTLRWEAFPNAKDQEADHEHVLSRIRNVTYDIEIFRAGEEDQPSELVYMRFGLPEPSHTVEDPLQPSAKYFWTVRTRFELDRNIRVSPWSRVRGPGSTDVIVPSRFYFRLRAPSQ
jgi:hypothetical protein